jgi:glutaredoxin
MNTTKVEGTDKGTILVFALSTCIWCKKTKTLLKDLGVAYEYVHVDETHGEEREEILDQLKQWNPQLSYPTIVIDKKTCVKGFREDEIRKAIGL